jgi:ABC-type multidrug transport system ATPase subunit
MAEERPPRLSKRAQLGLTWVESWMPGIQNVPRSRLIEDGRPLAYIGLSITWIPVCIVAGLLFFLLSFAIGNSRDVNYPLLFETFAILGFLAALIVFLGLAICLWGFASLFLISRAARRATYTPTPASPSSEARAGRGDERNLQDAFILQSLEWKGTTLLADGQYRFAPRVNVLLGKNGYGKTQLLRTIAALMQRDGARSRQLLEARGLPSQLRLEITRNGSTEEIIRDAEGFSDYVGRIPLLAIPDLRFVNRSILSVTAAPTGAEPLSKSGAQQFLTQEPYENVVQETLAQIGLDYFERGSTFTEPLFQLIETVVRSLTDDEDFAFDAIKRTGRSGFQILIRTSASPTPLPIQSASQGTLSVVAIFALIYSFLHSLNADIPESQILAAPGIVIVDEIDAHLHPSWQQKIMAMLTGKFPNVQFIVSAHSPVIVAGCDFGEVAVLRRDKKNGRFHLETLEEDFLGATAHDLYDKVFEIEDIDRLYLEYATKATLPDADARERESLENKEKRSPEEEQRLDWLRREDRLMRRAAAAREERLKLEQTEAQIASLTAEVASLRSAAKESAAATPSANSGCTAISVVLELHTPDRLRKIVFGLERTCPNDVPAWAVHFEMHQRENPGDDFKVIVKLDVAVPANLYREIEATAKNGLDPSQTSQAFIAGHTAADVKAGRADVEELNHDIEAVVRVRENVNGIPR